MRTISVKVAANDSNEIGVAGDYVRVKQATGDIRVENPEASEIVEAAQGDDFQFTPFHSLKIYNDTASDQTVKLTVSRGKKAGSAQVGGTVTVSGALTVDTNSAFTQSRASVTNVNQAIIAANASRKYLLIQNNDAAAVLRVTLDGNAATASQGFRIQPGGSLELAAFVNTAAVNAIMETATAAAGNVEFTEA